MKNLKNKFTQKIDQLNIDIEQIRATELSIMENIHGNYDAINYTYKYLQSKIIPYFNKLKITKEAHRATRDLFLRCYLQIQSVTKLTDISDMQCIAYCARSLLELLIDLVLLSQNIIDDSIEKYTKFSKVQKYQMANKITTIKTTENLIHPSDISLYKSTIAKKSIIENDVKKYWGITRKGKPKWPDHWTGLDLKSRLNKLKKTYSKYDDLIDYYTNIYYHCNIFVHSDPTGIHKQPEKMYFYLVAHLYFNIYFMMIDIIQLVSEYFALNKFIPTIGNDIEDIKFSLTYFVNIKIINKLGTAGN